MADDAHGSENAGLLKKAVDHLRQAADALARCMGARSNGAGSTAAQPPFIDDRATTKQLGACFAIARRRGLSRDRVLGLVKERTGKERLEHLTRREASDLIDELGGGTGAHV